MSVATPNAWFKRLLFRLTGGGVVAGPFAGLRYGEFSVGSAYGAKLLGTYELELAPVVRRMLRRPWARVIDIGAAEGYYAVGWARFGQGMLPGEGPHVTAYEIESSGREAMAGMARANAVSRQLSIRGRCEPSDLRTALLPTAGAAAGPILLICDVEGFEEVLLDPVDIPELTSVHILVEVHDAMVPGVGAVLRQRFVGSHRIERVDARARTAADFPREAGWSALLPRLWRSRMLAEHRPPGMYWYVMEPLGTA